MASVDDVAVDRKDAQKVLLNLLGVDGGPGDECAIADAIVASAVESGVPEKRFTSDSAHKSIGFGSRGNLILKLPARGVKGPRRMFSAHMDTVPLCVGSCPVVDGDTVRGRDKALALGGDDRSGCSVLLSLVRHLASSDVPHPPLVFTWLVQEEVGLRGAKHINAGKLGSPESAYNFDGASPDKLVIGATGDVAVIIGVNGVASHAGVAPEKGVSAAAVFAAALASLTADGWHGLIEQPGGKGTSNVGVLRGGDATNVVMDRLDVRAEVRSHSPKFRRRILDRWKKTFGKAAADARSSEGSTASVEWSEELKYEAFKLSKNEPVVKRAMKAVRDCGREPTTVIGNGGLDANWLTAHGIPTVTLGCGQRGIHTTAETLHLPDYFDACDLALRLATSD